MVLTKSESSNSWSWAFHLFATKDGEMGCISTSAGPAPVSAETVKLGLEVPLICGLRARAVPSVNV